MKKIVLTVITGLLTAALGVTTAKAETFTWQSSPLTNLDPSGATIHGGFANFPSKAGLYIQQCAAPIGNNRPATCSDVVQVWVTTDGAPGSLKSNGDIQIKLTGSITGKGVSVDCTTSQCGLFFRLDHTAANDNSEDKFLPISFTKSAATPATPATPAVDDVSVTLNGSALTKNSPVNLAYRSEAKIVATSKTAAVITITSSTPDCVFANGGLTALKGNGVCAIDVKSATSSANFPFILVAGTQEISNLPASLKRGQLKTLPLETNFGEVITYKAIGKSCLIKGNSVLAKSSGICNLQASALAKVGMWNALNIKIKIKVQ